MRRVSVEEFRKNFNVYYRLAEFENIVLTCSGEDFVEVMLFRKNEEEKIKITSIHPDGKEVLLKLFGNLG